MDRFEKILISITILLLFVMFISIFIITDRHPESAETLNVIVLCILVIVTAIYAIFTLRIATETRKQATASMKMAEQMKEQRYDSARPIVDIDWAGRLGDIQKSRNTIHENTVVGLSIGDGIIPDKLTCIIRNIGVGPATDVRLYIQPGASLGGEHLRSFGSVPKDGHIHDGDFMQWPISVKNRDGRSYLLAYYTDTFGQYFESARDICVNKSKRNFIIGPLIIRKLDKAKDRDLIGRIWPSAEVEEKKS